jgi:hypothetical protein
MPHRLLPLAGSQVGNYGYVDAPVGLDARFNNPYDCELSKDRSYLYVADAGNHVIRRITLSGSYPVETFCPAANVTTIYTHPTTGNLWFFTHDYSNPNYQQRLHHINKVTPSGNVSIVQTLVGQTPVNALPDRNERFVRIKIGTEAFGLWTYWWDWYLIDSVAGSNPRHIYSEDRLEGPTGQLWSERYPDTAIFNTHYRDAWRQGLGIQRVAEHGAPYSHYEESHFPAVEKIVRGIPEGSYETVICVWGFMTKALYNADPSALDVTGQMDAGLGFPQMPAATLARDPISDSYYFPMNGGVNKAGLTYNIPINTVSIGVPGSQLSAISHSPSGSDSPGAFDG